MRLASLRTTVRRQAVLLIVRRIVHAVLCYSHRIVQSFGGLRSHEIKTPTKIRRSTREGQHKSNVTGHLAAIVHRFDCLELRVHETPDSICLKMRLCTCHLMLELDCDPSEE